jgi:hypothetical protein
MRGLIVALVAVLLAVAGCGGTEASAPAPTVRTNADQPSPEPAPKVEFVPAAEAICKRMQRDAEAVGAETESSDERLANLVDDWRSGVDELDRLEPPQQQKQQFEQMLVHYRNMSRAFDEMVEAEDETVLAAVAGGVVEGQRGSRAARKAGLDACAFFPEIEQPPADRQPLYDATRDLVPAHARVLRVDKLECDTSDSCRVEYELDRSIAARLRDARALLRAHGWKNIRSGQMPTGGWWIMANRNDYAATLEFVGDELPAHCGGRVKYGCSDGVWVHRFEVPEVLTGG